LAQGEAPFGWSWEDLASNRLTGQDELPSQPRPIRGAFPEAQSWANRFGSVSEDFP